MATVSKKKQLTNKKRVYKRVPKELIYEMEGLKINIEKLIKEEE